jgi:hypothetical protein
MNSKSRLSKETLHFGQEKERSLSTEAFMVDLTHWKEKMKNK